MTRLLTSALLLLLVSFAQAAPPPVYLWYEPEWFPGVEGGFAYWTGASKPSGKWGIAGPGISAEWSQGGESGWNSIGASADDTKAECGRDIVVPRAGKYRVWVRYVEHRRKKTPFTVQVGKASHVFGEKRVLPVDDEYLLYWGFTFAWDSFEANLDAGPTSLKLLIDRKGEAWRQVDVVLLTDDLKYEPHGREKPPFAYLNSRSVFPGLRADATAPPVAAKWARPKVGGKAFSLWTGVEADPKWWAKQKVETLRPVDVFHAHGSPTDIRPAFLKQFPKADETPLVTSPHLLPGFYLGNTPDLSPGTPLRQWLERTKVPFYIMTNYASGAYTEKTGPATYAALTGPLKDQFMGYIHGEAIGTVGVGFPEKASATRAEQVAALMTHLKADQAKRWSAIYKTKVDEAHWNKGIPCLSVDSTALCHLFYEMGADVVGYELDATMTNAMLRIAFLRGAARQYGKAWINYASGNFGDACNYFTQEPQVPRGAKAWFHSKYAVTDGVTAGWYRSLYHLNYTGGASAVYWEQNLVNQWILPGPGTHPIQLSPFGRGTDDFMKLIRKFPDPGEPITPVAFLLSHAHGYEPINYRARMLHHFHESAADRELRELFNVAYHPVARLEGEPASPYRQSMPGGTFGNIFDVLVDRPARIKAIHNYRVVYAAGDVNLAPLADELTRYVQAGGTLVVNVNAIKGLPKGLTGLTPAGKRARAEAWEAEADRKEAVPFEVEQVTLDTARAVAKAGERPIITRNAVGKGAVVVTLVPGMMGLDERAHPALPGLIAGLVKGQLPVEVSGTDGAGPPKGLLYQLSRNERGIVVTLLNTNGVDKTQSGIARVDRRQTMDVRLTAPGLSAATLHNGDEAESLKLTATPKGPPAATVRLGPGGLAIVQLTLKR